MAGTAAGCIEGAELGEQRPCLREGGRGRRVEPSELGRVPDSSRRQIERERREVGLKDLGRGPLGQLGVLLA
jgi:hypothetical protein